MYFSPLKSAVIYLVLGSLFVYFAYLSVDDTVFNFLTIVLMLISTFQFGISIRLFQLYFKIKQSKK